MNEPAEDVSPWDWRVSHSFRRGSGIRRSKVNAPVRPGTVVVLAVRVEDTLQMTPAGEQDVVEALSSNGPDPALREHVRPRCPEWGLQNMPPPYLTLVPPVIVRPMILTPAK
jgi:hypothetical protein